MAKEKSVRGATRFVDPPVRNPVAAPANENTGVLEWNRARREMERDIARHRGGNLGRLVADSRALRREARLARRVFPIGVVIAGLEAYDLWNNMPDVVPLPGNWVAITQCAYPGPFYGRSNHPLASCWTSGTFDPSAYLSTDADINQTFNTFYWDIGLMPGSFPHPFNVGGITRYQKPVGEPGRFYTPVPAPSVSPWPWTNPNVLRNSPSVRPELAPGPAPSEVEVPEAPPSEEQTTTPWLSVSWTPAPSGTVKANPGATPRRPPPKGDKDKKVRSTTKFGAAMILGIADTISEYSEIVDAFYDALPADVRRAYEKSLGFHWANVKGQWKWLPPSSLERGLLDNAGQYGIDGADWKSKAIYHHWAELDPVAAVNNMVGNWLEDRVLGDINRALPRNWINANQWGDEQVGRLISDFFKDNPIIAPR